MAQGSGARTEDEFFRRGKHVDGECDLVLVNLHTHPADEAADEPENGTHDCECVDLKVDVCLGVGKVSSLKAAVKSQARVVFRLCWPLEQSECSVTVFR